MSEPIIEPILFYLIDVSDSFKILFYVSGIITLIVSAIVFLSTDCKVPKNIKPYIISSIVLIVFGALTPSKETCYKMGAAKYVTPQNIEIVSKYIDDIASDINEGIKDTTREIMGYTSDFIYNIRNNEKLNNEGK